MRSTAAHSSGVPKRPSGTAASDLVSPVGGHVVGHRGHDRSGRDDVAGDVAAGELPGDAAGQAEQARLGRRVVGLAGLADLAADRRDVHDPAVARLHHPRRRAPDRVERAGEVRVEHGVPVLVGHADEQPVAGDAGVVHEHVDRPERGSRPRRRRGSTASVSETSARTATALPPSASTATRFRCAPASSLP